MIGIGKYKANINNMFYKGEVVFELKWVNNTYEFDFEIEAEDFGMPEITIKSIEEDGNTLNAVAEASILPGKDVEVSLTFEDDKCNGFLKIPFVGKVKIKDAVKIG